MKHPFTKKFSAALRKSTPEDNLVLEEAEKLKTKGYNAREIHEVLTKIQKGLLSSADAKIVGEAVEQMERYFD